MFILLRAKTNLVTLWEVIEQNNTDISDPSLNSLVIKNDCLTTRLQL